MKSPAEELGLQLISIEKQISGRFETKQQYQGIYNYCLIKLQIYMDNFDILILRQKYSLHVLHSGPNFNVNSVLNPTRPIFITVDG